jgi:hypothetical protein
MSALGGRWVRFDAATEDGQHDCRRPFILPGLFGPKVGAVWQCDCGRQWVVDRHLPPDVPGATPFKRWVLLTESLLDRSELLTSLTHQLAPELIGSEVARWRTQANAILLALEKRHLARWVGPLVAEPDDA